MHPRNCFLTLTYSDINLPSNYSVRVADWQRFAKRLRKVAPFRFFHCGEYGDLNNRPHYHALIFGQDFRKNSTEYSKSHSGERQYQSPLISEKWGLGIHTIGSLTFESAAYVARYAMKKINGPLAETHYQHLDPHTGELHQVDPEYATMSRRPGLGLSWIQKYMSQTYPRDYIIINGKKCRPPKYYDQQFEKHDPAGYELLRKKRALSGIANEPDNTPDRLHVRELVQAAKTTALSRNL